MSTVLINQIIRHRGLFACSNARYGLVRSFSASSEDGSHNNDGEQPLKDGVDKDQASLQNKGQESEKLIKNEKLFQSNVDDEADIKQTMAKTKNKLSSQLQSFSKEKLFQSNVDDEADVKQTMAKTKNKLSSQLQSFSKRKTEETNLENKDKQKAQVPIKKISKKKLVADGRSHEIKGKMFDILNSFKNIEEPKEKVQLFKPEKVVEKLPEGAALEKAAADVSKELPGVPGQTKAQLLKAVKDLATVKKSLKETMSSMKVNTAPMEKEENKIINENNKLFYKNKVSGLFNRDQLDMESLTKKRLDIFDLDNAATPVPDQCETWEAAHQHECIRAGTWAPRNYWDQQIQWTDDGKLWHLPLDNEAGLEDEKKSSFAEHIFLEHQLEGWCPKKGPIRHFMETVCVGLSKNPFVTVERKRAHLLWFKEYFNKRKDILEKLEVN